VERFTDVTILEVLWLTNLLLDSTIVVRMRLEAESSFPYAVDLYVAAIRVSK